ncbi:NYN domain-containing protein [Stenotrophomonas rhizophila]|uniref:NYN domain-containing protein n=1 Tax=Stenotrophomonas rhizophila TaxID=216778 RepID=UPI0028AA305A|nr:NYN domain-containing protein [Stenotrophomonas rhizophila]
MAPFSLSREWIAMRQIAVFVDAGYFWVQAGLVVHGARSRREDVCIDYAALRQEVLEQAAAQFPDSSLLRVYWYDGPGAQGIKAPSHHAIDEIDDFKLRLGTRNGYGDQKAVDGLIIADLIGLAQSKAIQGAIVLSGDADLTPGVVTAQGLGIRVHLLSMGTTAATSPFLRAEVDYKAHWADPTVQKFATAAVGAVVPPAQHVVAPGQALGACAPVAIEQELYEQIARKALDALQHSVNPIVLESGSIPKTADGRLLWIGSRELNRDLTDIEKRALRKTFKQLL